MADVSITLGVDGKALTSGLNQARQQVETFGKKASVAMSGGGAGGQRAGMLAMQVQDIAVQAQMGTNALQIFAQQGSQILSIFGPGGAIAGGVAAIAGALVYAGHQGNKAFNELVSSAATFDKQLGGMLASGSVSQMSEMMGELEGKAAELQTTLANVTSVSEGGTGSLKSFFLGAAGSLTGGDTQSEKQAKAQAAIANLERTRKTVITQILSLSEQENAISMAKAQGQDELAKKLTVQLELEKKIMSIRQMPIPTEAQDKLIQSAIKISEIESKQKTKTFDVAANLAKQADFAKDILSPYQQFLNYLDQAKQKQDALNAAAKAAKQIAQTKVESQKTFAQSLEDEVKILEAKATGDEKAIKKAEREVEIKNRAREIQQQLGKNAKEALDIAERMQALQDAANEAAEGKGKREGRIQGYSWERQGGSDEARGRAATRRKESDEKRAKAYERGFGGIGEFYENQTNPNFAKPQTPMLDASKLKPVQSSSDNNASVTALTEMKDLMARSVTALESLSAV
jgi:hypothetical protein